ncbi:MAG: hypothetical protein QOJ70_1060 [Acidobacteriota bacterium]|nr:hypothetical protein [Acidobacteriota bacterium]
MKTARLSSVLMLVGLFAVSSVAAQKVPLPSSPPVADSPTAVVRELYRVHRNGNGPLFEKKGRKFQEKFFDKKLAGLIWKDLTETPEGEIGHIDFDPLFASQDMKITNFRVGVAVLKGDEAEVPVTFNNYDQKVKITFRLVNTNTGWKISNILYADNSDFVKILSEP